MGSLQGQIYMKKSNLDNSIQKLTGLVTDGATSMAGRNCGVSSLITDVKNTKGGNLTISHCLIYQGNLRAKSFKMTNVGTLV
jgi:hypothetical protein